jgi:hypothetical protein
VPKPIHGLLDSLIEQFASAIAARAEQMLSRSGTLRLAARGGVGIRMCPYPGCKEAGAGPRNRWFCREHSRSVPVREQKRILLERAKANASAARLSRAASGTGRRLDMRCRVEGCKNARSALRLHLRRAPQGTLRQGAARGAGEVERLAPEEGRRLAPRRLRGSL